jgi:gluconolactonase
MQTNGECIARIKSCAGSTCTNVALNSAVDTVVITESSTGSVLIADIGTL